MIVLRLLPIFVIVLFILFQRNSIRIIKCERLTVKINLNIFAITLTEEKIKRFRPAKALKSVKSIYRIIKSARYLISKSDFSVLTTESVTNQFLLSYLSANARSVQYSFIESNNRENDIGCKNALDITARFSLVYLIISALIFLYYTVRNKLKRVIKNV